MSPSLRAAGALCFDPAGRLLQLVVFTETDWIKLQITLTLQNLCLPKEIVTMQQTPLIKAETFRSATRGITEERLENELLRVS